MTWHFKRTALAVVARCNRHIHACGVSAVYGWTGIPSHDGDGHEVNKLIRRSRASK